MHAVQRSAFQRAVRSAVTTRIGFALRTNSSAVAMRDTRSSRVDTPSAQSRERIWNAEFRSANGVTTFVVLVVVVESKMMGSANTGPNKSDESLKSFSQKKKKQKEKEILEELILRTIAT